MASLENLNFETQIPADIHIARIMQLHACISKLESLRPSKQVNSLFMHLVKLCIRPSSIDIKALPQEVQQKRRSLIILCGSAECLLELEFAAQLSKISQPLKSLNLFPYYGNYVKLASLEKKILIENGVVQPKKIAFVGSGPVPFTSIIMASQHMKSAHFDNFDIDEAANHAARKIVYSDSQIAKRMTFLTCDIMEVKDQLAEYDCIFLAALVGRNEEEKVKILKHIRKYMKDGGFLLVRSAKGARAFLYPAVEEHNLLDFEVLSICHPTNDVINSIILLRNSIFQFKEGHEKELPSIIDGNIRVLQSSFVTSKCSS